MENKCLKNVVIDINAAFVLLLNKRIVHLKGIPIGYTPTLTCFNQAADFHTVRYLAGKHIPHNTLIFLGLKENETGKWVMIETR
jgi:hypothetical protein